MTARTGMTNILTEFRGMAEAGTADYTLGSITYWSDDHLQDILDLHRRDVIFNQLQMYPTQISGGSLSYQDYRSQFGFYEATTGGTAIFYVQDSTGAVQGTTLYTPDYRRGQVQFAANTSGSVYYVTGRSYDLNAAAAEVWKKKASHYSVSAFDFSTDNHSVSRSQVYEHCLTMAAQYESLSGDAIQTIPMFRSDIP